MEKDNKPLEDSIMATKSKRKMTEAQLANLKKDQEVRNANQIKQAEEKKICG